MFPFHFPSHALELLGFYSQIVLTRVPVLRQIDKIDSDFESAALSPSAARPGKQLDILILN